MKSSVEVDIHGDQRHVLLSFMCQFINSIETIFDTNSFLLMAFTETKHVTNQYFCCKTSND